MDARTRDFSAARAAMQRYVDQEIIAGVSWAVLRGRDVVDQQCIGLADREANVALLPDHIFRAFSNTKLVVTCAIMLLVEEGRIGLDDVIEKFLPQLGNRKVLKAGDRYRRCRTGAGPDHDPPVADPYRRPEYGFLDPGTVMFKPTTKHACSVR